MFSSITTKLFRPKTSRQKRFVRLHNRRTSKRVALRLDRLEDIIAPSYTITAVFSDEARHVYVNSIDDNGHVFGAVQGGPGTEGYRFRWEDGQFYYDDLDYFGASDEFHNESVAIKHDATYLLAGSTTPASLDQREFEPGWTTYAWGINDNGTIIGLENYLDPGGEGYWHNPVYWSSYDAAISDIPFLTNESAGVNKINNAGQIIGGSFHFGGFVLEGGTTTFLGDLPGAYETGSSRTYDINSSGQIVGEGISSDGPRAIYWWANNLVNLGTLTDYETSRANAINDSGVIVGNSLDSDHHVPPVTNNYGHAVLWNSSLQFPIDLNDIVAHGDIELQEAVDINSSGQILVIGETPNFRRVGVVLTPDSTTPDIVATSLTWNTSAGSEGVDFRYEIKDAPLAQSTTAALYWSSSDQLAE